MKKQWIAGVYGLLLLTIVLLSLVINYNSQVLDSLSSLGSSLWHSMEVAAIHLNMLTP